MLVFKKEGKTRDIGIILARERKLILDLIKGTYYLSKNYNLGEKEIIKLISKKEVFIPIEIFCGERSPLESIVKYLKDELKFEFKEIANLLKRDYKTVWLTYKKAVEKSAKENGRVAKKISQKERKILKKLGLKEKTELYLPLEAFKEPWLGILECLVRFLKENYNLKFSEIAVLLRRDDRTIWTAYKKAREKTSKDNGESKEQKND